MEMFDKSQQLIREWETSGMEEDGCCCCCDRESGLHRHNTLIRLLHQKETRLRRMAQFLAVVLVLLMTVALGLLVVFVLGVRAQQSPSSQHVNQTEHTSDGTHKQQQGKDLDNPSAMLTVPVTHNYSVEFLQWESTMGRAYCHGGFSYSSGNLVVPRNGIYRVFLQITYQSECTDSEEELMLSNSVKLSKDSYPTYVPVLSSVDTVSCSMETRSKSLYTSGLFYLEANDKLRVHSSHRELIARSEYLVFFGAECLP